MIVDELRKLVAEALHPGVFRESPRLTDIERSIYTQFREQGLRQADAVLAALTEAGVLLPELPELPDWTWSVTVESVHGQPVSAMIEEWVMDDSRPPRWLSGTGPTIPAAIANALKGRRKVSIGNGMDDKPDGGY